MKTTAFVSIAIAMTVLAAQPATADPIARNHPINKSQQAQTEAVPEGEKSGDEVRGTKSTQSDIEKLEREYSVDGVLTSAERKDLEKRTADARSEAPE